MKFQLEFLLELLGGTITLLNSGPSTPRNGKTAALFIVSENGNRKGDFLVEGWCRYDRTVHDLDVPVGSDSN